jgi:hypothetical protein
VKTYRVVIGYRGAGTGSPMPREVEIQARDLTAARAKARGIAKRDESPNAYVYSVLCISCGQTRERELP